MIFLAMGKFCFLHRIHSSMTFSNGLSGHLVNKANRASHQFCRQAVIAIEKHAAAQRAARQSLQQQTATRRRTQSHQRLARRTGACLPGDVGGMPRGCARPVTATCGSAKATHFATVARSWRAAGSEPMAKRKPCSMASPEVPSVHAVRTRQPVHVADLRTTKAYLGRAIDWRALGADIAGIRTLVAVPMLQGERVDRSYNHLPQGGPTRSPTNQIELVTSFASAGRHRHREYPSAQRAARVAGQQSKTANRPDVLKVISRSTSISRASSHGWSSPPHTFASEAEYARHWPDRGFDLSL